MRPGQPVYDGIDFLRSGDPKTRLFVALKSKSKRGLANLLKHGAGFSRSSLAGVHRKLRDARGSKGRAVPAPIENDRFRSGFSDACQTQTRGGARRQASEKPRGNRGGSSHRRWCRSMGNLPALLDLICRFRTGRRLSDQPGAGFGRPGWDRRGDLVFGALGFVGRSWCRGSLSAKRGRCR